MLWINLLTPSPIRNRGCTLTENKTKKYPGRHIIVDESIHQELKSYCAETNKVMKNACNEILGDFLAKRRTATPMEVANVSSEAKPEA